MELRALFSSPTSWYIKKKKNYFGYHVLWDGALCFYYRAQSLAAVHGVEVRNGGDAATAAAKVNFAIVAP